MVRLWVVAVVAFGFAPREAREILAGFGGQLRLDVEGEAVRAARRGFAGGRGGRW